ncbi:protein kinase, partial [Acinetobacter baumannii]
GRFEGQAAIKILKRSRFAPDASAQIRREASLLARLSHPNIAHLLDAGIREDGRPFLILEYIEGERIDEHCSRNKIAVLERLRLFLTVLKAV